MTRDAGLLFNFNLKAKSRMSRMSRNPGPETKPFTFPFNL